jgi:hypothetical protein
MEEQTIQWPKDKNRQYNGQKIKDKRTINIYHKTKDRAIRTPLKTGGELKCSGSVGSSCSTSGIFQVLVCIR